MSLSQKKTLTTIHFFLYYYYGNIAFYICPYTTQHSTAYMKTQKHFNVIEILINDGGTNTQQFLKFVIILNIIIKFKPN